ncbi:MAG: CoA-binding protein [Bryobacteraceae bacterium]
MNDDALREFLKTVKTIAVVGLSSNPMRASHGVAQYLQGRGFKIYPVNPNETKVLGEPAVAELESVDDAIDIVDVFRRPEFVPQIAESAIRKGARCLWLQQGIVHPEAERKAEEAGLLVVSDRCLYREHRRLAG